MPIIHLQPLTALTFLYALTASTVQAAAHQWNHQWVNRHGDARQISVEISDDLSQKAYLGEGDLLDYKSIGEMVFKQVVTLAKNISTPEMQVSIKGNSLSNFTINVSSFEGNDAAANAAIARIETFVSEAMEPIEAKTYYVLNKTDRTLGIEYNEIIADYKPLITKTLLELADRLGMDSPDVLRDEMLSMLQSIPYTNLDKDDFPLLNPARMLIENRGDCESKQLFMAAILKLLYPESKVELVGLIDQEHIVLFYQPPGGEGMYMDATGPAQRPAGSLSPEYSLNGRVMRYDVRL